MNGSDGVGVGETPWQRQQRLAHWQQMHQGGGYPQQGGYIPPVEQAYQQQLYPGGQPYGYANAGPASNIPNYQYGGYGQPAPYQPAPPVLQQQPCPPGQAIYGGVSTCRPLPPTGVNPGVPAPPI